jgi:hypothetical protein
MLMLMTRMPQEVLDRLQGVASAVREMFDADGHEVDEALARHPSFGRENQRSRSSLTRDLLTAAARESGSRLGLNPGAGPGGCFEFRAIHDRRCLVLRLRAADKMEDGSYRILAGNAIMTDLECEGFIIDEPWVFGFTRDADGLGELFVAEVLDISDAKVPTLILGSVRTLISSGLSMPPEPTFEGDEDDLGDFSDEADTGDDDLGDDTGHAQAT